MTIDTKRLRELAAELLGSHRLTAHGSPVPASFVFSGSCGCRRGDRFWSDTDRWPGDIDLWWLIVGRRGLSGR